MRRLATSVLVLCLLFSTPSSFAANRDGQEPRDRDGRTGFVRFIKEIIRHFRPTAQGDLLGIPRP